MLENYSNALNDVTEYLLVDLKELDIQAAQIYGSSTYKKGFVPGVSDIDICVYTDKFSKESENEVVKIIKNSSKNFKDKNPVIIDDYIAHRVEFYIDHPDIPFDITILQPSIPRVENINKTASYDSLDMIIGALYQHGVPLFGEIPEKERVDKEFLPFYNDNLRETRLDILGKRLNTYTKRVEILSNEKSPDLLDHLYKTRNHFIKWLFMYKKKYPVCLHKHLDYQFNEILNLDKEEQNILFFNKNQSIYDSASDFINLSKKYYINYNKEKTQKNKIIKMRQHILTGSSYEY
jgi:hypothetical protein